MAARKPIEDTMEEVMNDNLTFAVVKETKKDNEPRVSVFLPALEDSGSAGLQVDQYEHVTLSNEVSDEHFYIHRGEHVEVPVRVFIALKAKYPNL